MRILRIRIPTTVERLSTNLFSEPVPACGLVQMERGLQIPAEDADGAGERGGPEGRVANKKPTQKNPLKKTTKNPPKKNPLKMFFFFFFSILNL